MVNETREVYDSIEPNVGIGSASGIPAGFAFNTNNWQIEKCMEQINIFPPTGGCICLFSDGTWAGDIAPFAG